MLKTLLHLDDTPASCGSETGLPTKFILATCRHRERTQVTTHISGALPWIALEFSGAANSEWKVEVCDNDRSPVRTIVQSRFNNDWSSSFNRSSSLQMTIYSNCCWFLERLVTKAGHKKCGEGISFWNIWTYKYKRSPSLCPVHPFYWLNSSWRFNAKERKLRFHDVVKAEEPDSVVFKNLCRSQGEKQWNTKTNPQPRNPGAPDK